MLDEYKIDNFSGLRLENIMNLKNQNYSMVILFMTCVLLTLFIFMAACISPSVSVSNSPGQHADTTIKTPRFTQITGQGSTGFALRSDEKIICWGLNNGYGLNGVCDIPRNLTDVRSITPINYAIKKDGTVVHWGNSGMSLFPPPPPSNLTGVVSVTRARYCYVALRDDGTLTSWECGDETQKAAIANQSGLISISENLGLKKDGTVVTWNIDADLQSPFIRNLSDVIAISNHWENYAVLKKDGTVVAWRVPTRYQPDEGKVFPITVVENLADITAISAGYNHTLAIKRDGTVISWTNDSLRALNLTEISAISAGAQTDYALKKDGTIISWGDNDNGQLFTPEYDTNMKSISSGAGPNIILKNDGTIATWGYIEYMHGQEPAGIRNVTGILADYQSYLILTNNETIYGWGNPETLPLRAEPVIHPLLTLFNGMEKDNMTKHLYALKKDGNLVILPNKALTSGWLDNVTDVSSNGAGIIAVKTDGTVTELNYNGFRQTGIPKNLSGVSMVSAGGLHYLALKKDGTVVAWGGNAMGQTNVPVNLSDVTAISAGGFHSLALKKDGTVVCWGGNKYGECSVPENLDDVIAISAGEGQSLTLKKDGSMVAWGKTVIPDWYG
jgi:alpha-tubulin suppressor-like RCC1 family protein